MIENILDSPEQFPQSGISKYIRLLNILEWICIGIVIAGACLSLLQLPLLGFYTRLTGLSVLAFIYFPFWQLVLNSENHLPSRLFSFLVSITLFIFCAGIVLSTMSWLWLEQLHFYAIIAVPVYFFLCVALLLNKAWIFNIRTIKWCLRRVTPVFLWYIYIVLYSIINYYSKS